VVGVVGSDIRDSKKVEAQRYTKGKTG
jgi:hypothetical protein